jgi:hypothetical protein
MIRQVGGDDGPESRIGEVLGGYLAALEAGQAPPLAELLERHPDLAGELEAFFAQQERFALLVAPLREAAEAAREEQAKNVDLDATMASLTSRPPEQRGEAPGSRAIPRR